MKQKRSRISKTYTAALLTVLFCSSLLSGAWYGLKTQDEPSGDRIRIGFIGDSITHGASPGMNAVEHEINDLGSARYQAINEGVDGSTTIDWQPGHPLFDSAIAAFKAQHVQIVSLMLGTNDARTDIHVDPGIYASNVRAIIDGLLATGTIQHVIINYPPYFVSGTHQGLWSNDSVNRLLAYRIELDTLINQQPGVVRGDTDAYSYFEAHSTQLIDGVHPNAVGNDILGSLWAVAFKRAQLS